MTERGFTSAEIAATLTIIGLFMTTAFGVVHGHDREADVQEARGEFAALVTSAVMATRERSDVQLHVDAANDFVWVTVDSEVSSWIHFGGSNGVDLTATPDRQTLCIGGTSHPGRDCDIPIRPVIVEFKAGLSKAEVSVPIYGKGKTDD